MSKPSISILMPVYNGARFIQQTLEAICPQLTQEVEVIIIDDGSQDNTVEIIQQHFSSYIEIKQLRVLCQSNQGVSSARNWGVENAQGRYIGFMDADDLALPAYISTLLKTISQNVDIVEFGFKTFVSSVEETSNNPTLYTNKHFGYHEIQSVIEKVYCTARWYPWARIFKRNLLDGVLFPVGVRFCEDLMTIPKLYENAQTIFVLPDALYGYRTNPNSATFQVGKDYVEKLVSFYHSIPNSGLIRHDYLRISVAYAIVSCQIKFSGDWCLPSEIQADLYRLRFSLAVCRNIEPRRILILLYPSLFKKIKKVISYSNLFTKSSL